MKLLWDSSQFPHMLLYGHNNWPKCLDIFVIRGSLSKAEERNFPMICSTHNLWFSRTPKSNKGTLYISFDSCLKFAFPRLSPTTESLMRLTFSPVRTWEDHLFPNFLQPAIINSLIAEALTFSLNVVRAVCVSHNFSPSAWCPSHSNSVENGWACRSSWLAGSSGYPNAEQPEETGKQWKLIPWV